MALSRIKQSHMTGPVPFRFRFEYIIAFQPIFDLRSKRVWAYEALVRGPNGESARDVLDAVPVPALYAADQQCRESAICMASKLGMTERLSVNFLRGALFEPKDYLAQTLAYADSCDFPATNLILEFSETEQIKDIASGRRVVNHHAARGFQTAMDDFGAGFQGLSLLCDVYPDVIKLDMSLIRNVDQDPRRAKIVGAIVDLCRSLGIQPISEGVETAGELHCLRDLGIDHVQGFLLARPKMASLISSRQTECALASFVEPMSITAS